MRNFFERGFEPPQSLPESNKEKQEDKAPDPDKRETLRKLFKIGAVAATAPFVEPLLKAKDAFSQIESGEIKEIKDKVELVEIISDKIESENILEIFTSTQFTRKKIFYTVPNFFHRPPGTFDSRR